MQAEDRPIHFSTELIHPPMPVEKTALQKLYFEVSQERRAAYDSTDFSPPGPAKFYSKRGKQTQSILLFLPDRFVVVEEWVDMPLSAFLDKVEAVSQRVMAGLNLPPVAVQTATIRTTFGLTHFEDSRVFLLERVCQQQNRIGPSFGRPISVGGLRFVLPETPDFPGALHVVIESYQRSLNEVYVEVKGIYANQRIDPQGLAAARANIRSVHTFISNHVLPYLEQFDTPEPQAFDEA